MTLDNIKNPKLNRLSLYRGIYSRIAKQLGIDPSYVSRVARGERQSAKVEAALLKEMRRIEKNPN
jgi:transcriptional regulator with XRE-family HTH domain